MKCPYLSSISIDLECLLMSSRHGSRKRCLYLSNNTQIDRSRTVSTSWAAHRSILSGSCCCWASSRSTQKLKLQSSHSLQQQKHDDESELGSRNRIKKVVKKKHESCRDCNPAQIVSISAAAPTCCSCCEYWASNALFLAVWSGLPPTEHRSLQQDVLQRTRRKKLIARWWFFVSPFL